MGKAKSKKNFYAVHIGHQPGVYTSWDDAQPQTVGFRGAKHKGFETRAEAEYFFRHGHDMPAGGQSGAAVVGREITQVKKTGPMKAVTPKPCQLPARAASAASASASQSTSRLPSSSSGSGSGTPSVDFVTHHVSFTIHDDPDAFSSDLLEHFPPNIDLTGLPERTLLQFKSGQLTASQVMQIALARSKLAPSSPASSSSAVPTHAPSPRVPAERSDPNTIVVSAPPRLPEDQDVADFFITPSSHQLKMQFDRAIQVDGQRQVPFLEYGLQPGWLKVYTDGSCFGNGQGAAVARAGIGAFFGYGDPRNISEPLTLHTATDLPSNQKAEIQSVTEALKRVRPDQDVMILTDSQYVIKAMTDWIRKWRLKRFDGVANKEYFFALEAELGKRTAKIEWRYVPGHSGQEGNERADALAKAGAERFVNPLLADVGGNKGKGTSRT